MLVEIINFVVCVILCIKGFDFLEDGIFFMDFPDEEKSEDVVNSIGMGLLLVSAAVLIIMF